MRTETELRESVEYLAADAPTGDALLRNLWQARQRRQRRIIETTSILVVAAVMIVALVGAVRIMSVRTDLPAGPVTTNEPSVPSVTASQRIAGNWSMVSTVTPPAGWRIDNRDIQRSAETTTFKPIAGSNSESTCSVLVGGREGDAATPPAGVQRTTVAQKSGYYKPTEGDQAASGSFTWEYTSGAWAVADCVSVSDPKAMVGRLVAGFRLARQDLHLPFTLSALPDGYNIKWLSVGTENHLELAEADQDPGIETVSMFWTDADGTSMFDGAPRARQLGSNSVLSGQLKNGGQPAICLAGRPTVCAYDASADGNTSADLQQRMDLVMTDLKSATDLADQASWPVAADLPE